MSDDDIDLDRVISDPAYRRRVIEFLNTGGPTTGDEAQPPYSAAGMAEKKGRATVLG
jgi:hypothetical protein